MTLGEIKVETLKLMFVAYSKDFGVDALETLAQDENYGSYLANMPGAINRCFSAIEDKGVLPEKASPMEAVEYDTLLRITRFDLHHLPDLFEVKRIVCECEHGRYIENRDFALEGNNIVLFDTDQGDRFKVVYKPKITRVSSTTGDDEKIDVPDNIAAHIPYYVKGDLFRDDEPDEADKARVWFETALSAVKDRAPRAQSGVYTRYSLTEV